MTTPIDPDHYPYAAKVLDAADVLGYDLTRRDLYEFAAADLYEFAAAAATIGAYGESAEALRLARKVE